LIFSCKREERRFGDWMRGKMRKHDNGTGAEVKKMKKKILIKN